jgi:hypothetical protein
MIYVYAITAGAPSPATLESARGIDDAALDARGPRSVSAVYSAVEMSPRPSRESAVRHERVVERLMAKRTVLPARFGTVLRDAAALDEVLATNHERLVQGLERVDGCVELGVRVLWDAEGERVEEPAELPAGGGPGRAYLAARAAEERQRRRVEARAGELAANLNNLLRPGARDGVVRVPPDPRFVMAGAYLVAREKVAEFRHAVEDAARVFETLRLLCTGPWPPYHFVPELSPPAAEVRHA